MTIHILSKEPKNCIDFIEFFTQEKIQNSQELKEENITRKINLYSFMNYKIYNDASKLMQVLEDKVNESFTNSKTSIFSEVLIILDNIEIEKQIEIIRNEFEKDDNLQTNPHLNPFIIVISPKEVDLSCFIKSKTFHYKITLNNIFNLEKEGEKKIEVSEFIRKLNVLFCYYNELGDDFSFVNSEEKEYFINIEDDTNITIFVNILLLGMTGVGKSKLINLLLEEMKSIEGGSGFSTTSKNILVYKKHGFPIRFYDVKGIENGETLENYNKIIKDFNIKNFISNESLNTIFYCVEYKETGTIFLELENKLFEKLIKFDIPIFFIITKTEHDPSQKSKKKKIEIKREKDRKRIENAIYDLIQTSFKKNNRENEAQKYIARYIKIYFVNLVRIEKEPPIPVFGIDKVLSDFSEMVPKEEWDELELACKMKDEKRCKQFIKNNLFLRYYSELDNFNKRNKQQAKEYLKRLKTGAFFSGMVPGLDIGMEYYYKYLFKKRLKALYGFDYEQAKKALNETNIFDQTNKELKDLNLGSLGVMNDEEINLIEKEEKVNNMDGANNINMDTEKDEEKKIFQMKKTKIQAILVKM